MTPQQAQMIATMAPEPAGQVMGLPAAQVAKMLQNGTEFFVITPKAGLTPSVFDSEIAGTSQGKVMMPGGAQQVIVPNRNLWTEPVPVDPLSMTPKGMN